MEEEEQEGSQEGWGQVAGWAEEGFEHCKVICLSEDVTLCLEVSKQDEEEEATYNIFN